MRINRILAVILCIAGLASCEKEATVTVSPEGDRTDVITIGLDIPSTRLNLQMDGNAMKTKWEVGDSVSVVYYQSGYDANDNYYSRYVNDPYYIKKASDISADGKKAKFTCDNPHFQYGVFGDKVSVTYPYLYSWEDSDSKPEIMFDSQKGGSLENIKPYLLMGASSIEAGTDGISGEVVLKPYVSVLKFPAGLTLNDLYTTEKNPVIALVVKSYYFYYCYTFSGSSIKQETKARDIVVRPDNAYIENKKLTKDIYVVIGFDGNPYTPSSQVGMFITYDDAGSSVVFSLKPRTLQPGYVYTITEESFYTD